MKIKKIIFYITAIILFSGCHHGLNKKESTDAFAIKYDHYRDSITLVFNEPMIPVAVDSSIIEISPEIKCPWVWLSDKALRCLFYSYDDEYDDYEDENDILHNTAYTVHLRKGLETVNGHTIPPAEKTFIPFRPEINGLEIVQWIKPNQPIFRVSFNTPVQLKHLTASSFSLIHNQQSIDLRLMTFDQYKHYLPDWYHSNNNSPNRALYLTTENDLEHSTTYLLSLDKALVPVEGNVKSLTGLSEFKIKTFATTFQSSKLICTQSRWDIKGQSYEPPCYFDDFAYVETNWPLSHIEDSDCQTFNTVEPSYSDSIYGLIFPISDLLDSKQDKLKCLQQTKNIFGQAIDLSSNLDLIFDRGFRPHLKLAQNKNQYLPINQNLDIEVLSMNIESFMVHIEQINGKTVNENIIQNIDHYQSNTEILSAVDLPYDEDIQSLSGHIKLLNQAENNIPFNIIKAPFHINIKSNLRQFAVMLNEADMLAPIQEAQISLITPKLTYVAETDQTGIAIFNTEPMDFENNQAISEVSMDIDFKGTTYTFNDLPQFTKQHSPESYDPDYSSLEEGTFLIWGITDKPIYRAGERVKYQMYVREKHDNNFIIPENIPTVLGAVSGRNFQSHEYIDCYDSYSDCESFYKVVIDEWNEFGGYSGEFDIPQNMFNGEFRFQFNLPLIEKRGEAFPSDKGIYSDIWFQITDFKTSPFLLQVNTDAPFANNQQALKVNAKATYYSGGPVINEKAEITTEYIGKSITDAYPKYADYQFSACDNCYGSSKFYGPLSYDQMGQLEFQFIPEDEEIEFGHIKINSGIKPEGTGWTYSRDLIVPYHSKPYFLGARTEHHQYRVNEPFDLETILIDFEGQKDSFDELLVEVNSYSHQHKKTEQLEKFTCQSQTPCTHSISQPGRFNLNIKTNKDQVLIENNELVIYITENEDLFVSSDRKSSKIIANQESYQVGDTAEFQILFPSANIKAAVFAERNQILNNWYQETSDGSINISFLVTEKHVPGFSISSIILGVDGQKYHTLKFQIDNETKHFEVTSTNTTQSFTFNTNQTIYQPGEIVELEINSEFPGPAEFSVALINEAVISFVDPKIYYDLSESTLRLAPKGWEAMESYEMYPVSLVKLKEDEQKEAEKLLQPDDDIQVMNMFDDNLEEQGKITVTGSSINREDLGAFAPGVSGGFLAKPDFHHGFQTASPEVSVGPYKIDASSIRQIFKESAYFRSGIRTQAKQAATVKIKLPDNIGSWRVVVVGTDQSGYIDLQQQNIQATKNLEMYSNLPDQLTYGDRFIGSFQVISKSALPTAIQMAAGAYSNNTDLLSQSDNMIDSVISNQQYKLPIEVLAANESDIKMISIAKDEYTEEGLLKTIPVRRPDLTGKESKLGQFNTDELSINFNLNQPINNSIAELQLNISRGLSSQMHPTFKFMHEYPHACWEQTLSKAVSGFISMKLDATKNPEIQQASLTQVQNTLNQAVDFQASNGGMTFFNAKKENVNVYLTFHTYRVFEFFEHHGLSVPKSVKQNITAFARHYISEYHDQLGDDEKYYDEINYLYHPELFLMASHITNQTNQLTDKRFYDSTIADKKTQKLVFDLEQELLANIDQLSTNSLIQLLNDNHQMFTSTELLSALNQDYFRNGQLLSLLDEDSSHWELMSSPLKTQCTTISALLNQSYKDSLKPQIYQHILSVMNYPTNSGVWGSTLENSLCLVAFYEYITAFENNTDFRNVKVLLNDHSYPLLEDELQFKIPADQQIDLKILNPEQQQLYYSAEVTYRKSADTKPQVGSGIEMKRSYQKFTAKGWCNIDTNGLKTGDWIKTELVIHNPIERSFVAVSSPNPGGWTPVDIMLESTVPVGIISQDKKTRNSSYFYERQLKPATSLFYADYLPAGSHTITYYSQVLVAGEFSVLPAQVEAMYNSEIKSQTNYEKVTIDL